MKAVVRVAYDGTGYAGWQVQPGAPTVQGKLEEALSALFGLSVRVTGSGRTDAGVHAVGQVCSFPFPDGVWIRPEKIADALNTKLPPDIRALESAAAPDSFDAMRSAKRKTYRYSWYISARENPLYERYAVRADAFPDGERTRAACAALCGEHDFSAFRAAGSSAVTTVRTVYSASCAREGDRLYFVITGNGFLYKMVRICAGAVFDEGRGLLPAGTVRAALAGGDRELLGKTLPARGLTLESVTYGTELFSSRDRQSE